MANIILMRVHLDRNFENDLHKILAKGRNIKMTPPEPELIPLGPDDSFTFGCHPKVPCFNHCCRDLNQALTPYDVLRLRAHMDLSWKAFLQRYATVYPGPASGLPVVSLRFQKDRDRSCPFVTPKGCQVYNARPSSCRIYPLARALQRSRRDGSISEHYALLREPHCRGFQQDLTQTVRQWIADQQVAPYFVFNDTLLELIALKNKERPGPLSPTHQQWVQTALYDIDALRQLAETHQLPATQSQDLPPLPKAGAGKDELWLRWGMMWIRRALFGSAEL